MIDSLKDEEHMQIMFEYATENPNNKVRAGAFKLIMCLCSKNLRSPSDSYDDSYDESNSDEVETQKNAFVDFYEIKIDKICEFISKPFSNNQVFESSNEQAIEVLLFFIKTIQISIEEIEEPLLKCLNYLFDKFFEGSWFTKLHASCYHLFMAICHDKETVQKCDLKNRILNYVNSHQHSVVDYGYVYKIANEIVSIEGEEDKQDESNKEARNEENSRTNEEVNEKVIEENWSKFVENELKEYNQKIEADYGGEKPKVDSYDSTYSDNNLNAIDEMIKKFDDEEVKISSSSSNSDDIIKKSPVQKWSDEDEQIDKELRLTELDFDFVISKPNTDPGSPWAKEIVDEMENNEDDFFIPRKEKTDNQINWANKALKELQEEELKGDQFDLDNIPDPED
ncbi:hypothetical protein TRFO_31440 [Tritrichomonas foetus]|uniref:Uncharacterized protein n=1 Tax=Tritrichomonas foetus TaxID=1144522 RepID=A0A1J4JRK1_9EUKA|nr:hypothetical protein TRFO_31440 [Tritrichomonas foetus]|eukprot:OHT01659.1 hypothetical protein TRFO_31440 [Tritrichomonas foetus]